MVRCFVVAALWLVVALPANAMERQTQQTGSTPYYFSTSSIRDLGWENPEAATGNPLKGLLGSPSFSDYDFSVTSIDASLEFFYIGLNELMFADPDVDPVNAFDWSFLDAALELSASRHRHAVLTFNVLYPGQESNLPQYLIDAGLTMHYFNTDIGEGYSPDYGDPIILKAFRQFVQALGARYDGDTRIGFIHLGLLGYWGEWHTFPDDEWVPEHAKQSVGQWYTESFKTTQLQGRYPAQALYDAKIGLYDGSFAFHTLDGDANGGQYHPEWYFWPLVQQAGHDDFWRFSAMGGETRPELQKEIFSPTYAAGTYERQDFTRVVYTTVSAPTSYEAYSNIAMKCPQHASYIFHHDAFNHGGYSNETLANALRAHSRLGYSFLVTRVAVAESKDDGFVDIDVTVRQIGVAPFYYPLNLNIDCDGIDMARSRDGVENLIDDLDTETFTFERIPANTLCLRSVRIFLDSPHTYAGRPIRFAQGTDGNIDINIPQPAAAVSVDHIVDEPTGVLDGFWIVSANGRDYEQLRPLKNGDVVDLAEFRGKSWTVQAQVNDDSMSDTITFRYNNRSHRVSHNPFVLEADVMGRSDPSSFLETPGSKTVTATVFNYEKQATGVGKVSFEIIDSDPQTRPTEPPIPDNRSVMTVDTPHGFNTGATPNGTQLEGQQRKKAGRKVTGFLLGLLFPLMLLGAISVGLRHARRQQCWCFAPSVPTDRCVDEKEIVENYDLDDKTTPLSDIERYSTRSSRD